MSLLIKTAAAMAAVPNRETFAQGVKAVASAGTAEQLPDQAVPDGFSITVRGHPDNSGYVFIGSTKEAAEAHTTPVGPDDVYSLRLKNVNGIWVDAQYSGEKLIWVVEE